MAIYSIDKEIVIPKCPFRVKKKGVMYECAKNCELYIGTFPFGNCALRILALNAQSQNQEPIEKTENS